MQSSDDKLAESLAALGRDDRARSAMLSVLRAWEVRHRQIDRDVREEVVGPVVDALFRDIDGVTRQLANGVVFTQPYRSKIAREFALGDDPPDHVWEPQTTRLLLRLADEARTVLIGGAYAGDHAILLAHRLAGRGQMLCFEPNDEQRAALLRNAQANALNNISVSSDGLWDEPAHLRLEGRDSHARPVPCSTDEPESIPTTTIDAVCAAAGIDGLDLIVLDIEGGEFKALKGASGQLARPPGQAPDLVFEIHRAYTDWSRGLDQTDVVQLVTAAGYRCFAIRDYQGNVAMADKPLELIPTESVYLEGPPHGFNLLASKRPDIVDRLGGRVRTGLSPKLLYHRDPALHQPLED